MGDVVHLTHDRSPESRLGEIRDEVYLTVDRMCMRVGELLEEARRLDPNGFNRWVEEEMPFGLDKARRLIAIFLAYRELPAETLTQMPRPWQAMFALRKFPAGQLAAAIESGEIGPDTTVSEATRKAREWSSNRPRRDHDLKPRYSAADLRAGALMDCDPRELDEHVRAALIRWLGPGLSTSG